eukprot:gene14408-biopygen118535
MCQSVCNRHHGCGAVTVEFAPHEGGGAAPVDPDDGWIDLGGGRCMDADGQTLSQMNIDFTDHAAWAGPICPWVHGTSKRFHVALCMDGTGGQGDGIAAGKQAASGLCDETVETAQGLLSRASSAWRRILLRMNAAALQRALKYTRAMTAATVTVTGMEKGGGVPPVTRGRGNIENDDQFAGYTHVERVFEEAVWDFCRSRAPRCVLHATPTNITTGITTPNELVECWTSATFATGHGGKGRCAGIATDSRGMGALAGELVPGATSPGSCHTLCAKEPRCAAVTVLPQRWRAAGVEVWFTAWRVQFCVMSKIGWASPSFARIDGYSDKGVGDDEHSWGVDGMRKVKLGAGNAQPWDTEWRDGDVIGVAANLSSGQLFFARNGAWQHVFTDGQLTAKRMFEPWQVGDVIGVAADLLRGELHFARNGEWFLAFSDVHPAGGLYPAFSSQQSNHSVNFGASPFRFGPPDPTFRAVAPHLTEDDLVVIRGPQRNLLDCMGVCEDSDGCGALEWMGNGTCTLFDACGKEGTGDEMSTIVMQLDEVTATQAFGFSPADVGGAPYATRVVVDAACGGGEEGHDYFLAPCPTPPSLADCEMQCTNDSAPVRRLRGACAALVRRLRGAFAIRVAIRVAVRVAIRVAVRVAIRVAIGSSVLGSVRFVVRSLSFDRCRSICHAGGPYGQNYCIKWYSGCSTLSGVHGAGAMDGVLYTAAPVGHLPVTGAVQQAVDEDAECRVRCEDAYYCAGDLGVHSQHSNVPRGAAYIKHASVATPGTTSVVGDTQGRCVQVNPQDDDNTDCQMSRAFAIIPCTVLVVLSLGAVVCRYAIVRHRDAAVATPQCVPAAHSAAAVMKRRQSRRQLLFSSATADPIRDSPFRQSASPPSPFSSKEVHDGAASPAPGSGGNVDTGLAIAPLGILGSPKGRSPRRVRSGSDTLSGQGYSIAMVPTSQSDVELQIQTKDSHQGEIGLHDMTQSHMAASEQQVLPAGGGYEQHSIPNTACDNIGGIAKFTMTDRAIIVNHTYATHSMPVGKSVATEAPQISVSQFEEMVSALQAIGPLREEINSLKAREEHNAMKAREEINALKAELRTGQDIRDRISALEAASPLRDTSKTQRTGVARTDADAAQETLAVLHQKGAPLPSRTPLAAAAVSPSGSGSVTAPCVRNEADVHGLHQAGASAFPRSMSSSISTKERDGGVKSTQVGGMRKALSEVLQLRRHASHDDPCDRSRGTPTAASPCAMLSAAAEAAGDAGEFRDAARAALDGLLRQG